MAAKFWNEKPWRSKMSIIRDEDPPSLVAAIVLFVVAALFAIWRFHVG